MTTLSSTASLTRQTLKFLIIAIIGLIALFIAFKIASFVLSRISPKTPPPITVAYGKIPKLDLSEGIVPASGTNYEIETISGDLPKLKQSAKVFEIKGITSTFGRLEETNRKAGKIGFSETPLGVSQGIAKYTDNKDRSRILTINTFSGSFSLESDYKINPEIVSSKVKSEDKIVQNIISFMKIIGLPENSFGEDDINVEYLKIENGQTVKIASLANANLVKVIFNRKNIDEFPVYFPNLENPAAWALATNETIVAAKYAGVKILEHKFATYPLKEVNEAFEDLKAGKGKINKNLDDSIFEIRKVNLGYLEANNNEKYLQPVYVFIGDDGLNAFVSAVSDFWVD